MTISYAFKLTLIQAYLYPKTFAFMEGRSTFRGPNKPYDMTRNNLVLIAVALFCSTSVLKAQSPGGISTNLSLWMKADNALPAAGGNLTQWKDEKNVNTFTRSGTLTTVTNAINFHSVVRFAGASRLTGNANINWSEASTVVVYNGDPNSERGTVLSPTTSGTAVNDAARYFFRSGVEGGTGYCYSGMGTDSIGFVYTAAPPDDSVNLLTASGVGNVFNRNGVDAHVGMLYGGFAARATVMNGLTPQLGERSTADGKYLKGDIAEVVLYGQNNAASRNRVESYLALKYGITLGTSASLVNYVSSNGTTFWTGNATYQKNIFGIGNDQGSGLVQPQSNSMNSGSGNGTGLSGKGNLVLTAIGTLASQQFLMIGTDLASLGEQNITAGIGPASAITSKRLIREWKVQNTGSVGAVKLTFDKTGITLSGNNTASNYWLVIDMDGDGNFTTGTQDFHNATSVSGNLIVFNAVTLPNNAVFTIITKPGSNVVLAVDWQDFHASVQQNTAVLQWTVAHEESIIRWDIERSGNSTDFATTGTLPGRQATDGGTYTYQEQPVAGIWYYRIRSTDQDGHAMYSPVRTVTITAAANIFLHMRSNPIVGGSLQLNIWLPEKRSTLIRIADREGRPLFQQYYQLLQGNNPVAIDLSNYPAGIYFVQARTSEESKTLSFLK
jgi:hypothetical protein